MNNKLLAPDLSFHGVPLPAVTHEGSLWFRSADLARALAFPREDDVSQIYRRHKGEFRPSMTQVVEIVAERQFDVLRESAQVVEITPERQFDVLRESAQAAEITPEPQIEVLGRTPSPQGRTRIFSLRGCHLVAMLARTPVAAEFRAWVLDLLDVVAAENPVVDSHAAWKRVTGHTRAFRLGLMEIGRSVGRLDRYNPAYRKRILEVCELRDAGYTIRQIAAELSISYGSASHILKTHYAHLEGWSVSLEGYRRELDEAPAVRPKGLSD